MSTLGLKPVGISYKCKKYVKIIDIFLIFIFSFQLSTFNLFRFSRFRFHGVNLLYDKSEKKVSHIIIF